MSRWGGLIVRPDRVVITGGVLSSLRWSGGISLSSTRDWLLLSSSNSIESSGLLSFSFVGFCDHRHLGLDGSERQQLADFVSVHHCHLGLDGSKRQQLAAFVSVPTLLPFGHFVADLHCAPFELFDDNAV
jgi:hypothetical protein